MPPRRATVIANTDVETYKPGQGRFQAIIEQRPEPADSLPAFRNADCSVWNWNKVIRPQNEWANPGSAAIGPQDSNSLVWTDAHSSGIHPKRTGKIRTLRSLASID